MYSMPSSCRDRISISAPDNNSTMFYPLLRVNEPGCSRPGACMSRSLASCESRTGCSATLIERGCLLASHSPEGCGERPINGMRSQETAQRPVRDQFRGAFSVVADGGYLPGIACRIDPSLQATGNFDSGKLRVNSNSRILCPISPKVCHTFDEDSARI